LAGKIISSNSATATKIRQAPNLSQIQQVAKTQAATLVQYSVIDDNIYAWVIKPTGKIAFSQTKLPPKTTLKDLVVTTRDSIGANRGRRNKDNAAPAASGGDLQQLHRLLIAPIAKDLPTNPAERVIILPQNELFLVPFAALRDAQGKYLLEQHTLTIAPSIQVLALTERTSNRKTKTPPLVVGNPVMPLYKGERLTNLAGAESEAKAISQILQVQPLIGAQADKQQVINLMQKAPIIHLATHGLLDTIKGDIPGAIALTNGFLTSGEIFEMQLSADLVVLSACDTGRGDLTGDGVVGLSRSLAVAGVPSVLVSLWEVSDEATKALMEEFYRNLHVKQLTKAQALRQAMLTTMKDYPNPNFWAAFMLVGEGK
jgi:CHAT domain-containing protein